MLTSVYRLVRPRQFELVFNDITIDKEHIIVHPIRLSICNADQRYYQGLRAENILRKKLPMALIHEAVGRVVYDPSGQFKEGTLVVMIPNTPSEKDDIIAENYLRSSKFRASGFDGFMQEYVSMKPDRLVVLPDDINLSVAAFTEIVSVSYHAIQRFLRFSHSRRNVIGVWGDGNLGYITSLLLKTILPDTRVCVFGVNEYKMHDFSFADDIYLISDIPDDLQLDHAFECVGGAASSKAINQIIDYINPEGTISIMGVSEDLAPLNTRMILEKGLRIFGSSRSGREDFVGLINLYKENPDLVNQLEKIVGAEIPVRTIQDITRAFEADIHKIMGKTIMIWEN